MNQRAILMRFELTTYRLVHALYPLWHAVPKQYSHAVPKQN